MAMKDSNLYSEEHISRLDYTVDDNGIWLRCTGCDWERPLGFGPSVAEAATAWGAHADEFREG